MRIRMVRKICLKIKSAFVCNGLLSPKSINFRVVTFNDQKS